MKITSSTLNYLVIPNRLYIYCEIKMLSSSKMIHQSLLTKCLRLGMLNRASTTYKQVNNDCQDGNNLLDLCKYLNISESKAQYLRMKNRGVRRLKTNEIKDLVKTINDLGFPTNVLVDQPSLCSMLPVTIKFRFKVLQECGIQNLSCTHLVSYMLLVKQKTVGELKYSGIISTLINIENKLANYMTQWPTSLTTLVYGNVDRYTLYALRLKIIQRYLELVLDLSEKEFLRGLQTYPTVKHRPLQIINETLSILQTQFLLPAEKIKSNFYLIHIDPENLRNILLKCRLIGGIDIKEIIRMYPKIATRRCSSLLEMKKVLEEFGISNDAQKRCFQIYTLGPQTVRERLEKATKIPEFSTFSKHPRFLKMIYYNNTAMKRLRNLYDNNKKCLSLNILSGSSAHYEIFQKAPGDRLGKGKDLVFCISEFLGSKYSMNDIRKKVKRHPFWINIPLVQIRYVHKKLSPEFSAEDIYENCPILLYPWNKIKEVMLQMSKYMESNQQVHDLDFRNISNSQKLSMMLYLLERKHYFSGNGVWNDEKNKSINTSTNVEHN